MKFLHLSDLHLGKRVNEVSMLDDQDYILHQILEITDAEHPDAVVIAGDVYDKSVPSGEAITLFDWFLVALAKRSIPVLLISGNHDSPERLAFGNRLLDASGIHISPVYDGQIHPVILQDEHGPVHFWLLPFIKPAHVKRFLPDEPIESYTDACRAAIAQMNVDFSARNVLVTHQFVTGANTCESEELSVGGADNVDASVFEGFDYVALGHIHGMLKDMVNCIKELLMDGKNVKIDDLGIFSVGIRSKGAVTPEDFSTQGNIIGVRLRARATGNLSSASLKLTAKLREYTEYSNGEVTPGGGDSESPDEI